MGGGEGNKGGRRERGVVLVGGKDGREKGGGETGGEGVGER
jgi:hypothetical protein